MLWDFQTLKNKQQGIFQRNTQGCSAGLCTITD